MTMTPTRYLPKELLEPDFAIGEELAASTVIDCFHFRLDRKPDLPFDLRPPL